LVKGNVVDPVFTEVVMLTFKVGNTLQNSKDENPLTKNESVLRITSG
jgi:hypothetical protein